MAKHGMFIWLAGFAFGVTQTFYLDSVGLLHTFTASICDTAASLTMAIGLAVLILAGTRER